MAMVVQVLVLLCLFFSISGSSDVLKAVGDSVQLEIQNPEAEIKILSWIFNGSKNVLDYVKKNNDIDLSPEYKDRVEFNNKTYSLTLKNLQKTDSGRYTATASGVAVAEYRLSVIDPVEPPVLTVYNSTDPCNITLTCGGHNLSINSTCYKETCEKTKETSSRDATLTLALFVSDDRIICNLSNPVSWKKDELQMVELKKLCLSKGGDKIITPGLDPRLYIVGGIVVVIVVVIIGVSIFVWRCCRKKSSDYVGPPQCETEYAEVMLPKDDRATLPMTELETTSTPPNPDNQRPSKTGEQEAMNTYETVPDVKPLETKPETIYATVNKPGKSNV